MGSLFKGARERDRKRQAALLDGLSTRWKTGSNAFLASCTALLDKGVLVLQGSAGVLRYTLAELESVWVETDSYRDAAGDRLARFWVCLGPLRLSEEAYETAEGAGEAAAAVGSRLGLPVREGRPSARSCGSCGRAASPDVRCCKKCGAKL